MDVVGEMKAVEAAIGGRVGEAVSGAKAAAGKASGAGGVLKSGLRGIGSKIAGLGTVAMIALGLVAVAACASPIAIWSAYHSGKAVEAERDRTAAAEAVARQAAIDKAAIARSSARLAVTERTDRAEVVRLRHVADRLNHRPATKLCPPTVYEVLRQAGYTPVPGHE